VNDRGQYPLSGHVAVLSPHLDDGVYSLGAAISESVQAGAQVSLITVFAGDPHASRAASPWDQQLGFTSAGEATRARREEDARACALLGAVPTWLPFDDEHGRPSQDDEVWVAIEQAVGRAECVLVPGFPLDHEDHRRLARMALANGLPSSRVGLYVEQPYAAVLGDPPAVPAWLAPLVGAEAQWHALRVGPRARLRKARAWGAYRSQFRHFGYRSLVNVLRYEARRGGELTTLQ
jgi:LmbE family N-acetylglucosaminyl deacetylase